MAGTLILRILITGICAIVPSAKDPNVTRIIAPNDMTVSLRSHHIPDHFAFLDIGANNFRKVDRAPDFQYHDNDANEDRLIFIVDSEQIALGVAPTNTTHTTNDVKPADQENPSVNAAVAGGPVEAESTYYDLQMKKVCPKCGPIKKEYFDVFKHPELVALRMDLRGGRESTTEETNYHKLWTFKGTNINQPLAQQAAFEFDVPSDVEELVLTRGADGQVSHIDLVSDQGNPIDVIVGNEPLREILLLDTRIPSGSKDPAFREHFPLIYEMFSKKPAGAPLPELSARGDVRGLGDDCIPPKVASQDPTQ